MTLKTLPASHDRGAGSGVYKNFDNINAWEIIVINVKE